MASRYPDTFYLLKLLSFTGAEAEERLDGERAPRVISRSY